MQSPRTAKRSAAGPKGEGASQSDRRKIPLNRRAVVLMKNWFEKHSNNPYPSEEQKLYFALKGKARGVAAHCVAP